MYRITIGCHLEYVASTAQSAVFIVQPPAHPRQLVDNEVFALSGAKLTGSFVDHFGNRCQRVTLLPGQSGLRYEAEAVVPREADVVNPQARLVPPEELPDHLLRYTLPSRYAETDVLLGFAWEKFAHVPAGWERARAICDWVHDEVKYEQGVSRWYWSAADTIVRGQGVCRDRAHAVVALCRAFNMPARYAVSYLPDIEVEDDGIPPDFHAYAEVWLEGGWQVFGIRTICFHARDGSSWRAASTPPTPPSPPSTAARGWCTSRCVPTTCASRRTSRPRSPDRRRASALARRRRRRRLAGRRGHLHEAADDRVQRRPVLPPSGMMRSAHRFDGSTNARCIGRTVA